VSTNSTKTKTTTYGRCRRQIGLTKMVLRSRPKSEAVITSARNNTSARFLRLYPCFLLCLCPIQWNCVGHKFFWIGHPRKYRYSLAVGISQMLFLTEGFTISGLRHHLGFSYVGPWHRICIPGLQLRTITQAYDNMIPKSNTCS